MDVKTEAVFRYLLDHLGKVGYRFGLTFAVESSEALAYMPQWKNWFKQYESTDPFQRWMIYGIK